MVRLTESFGRLFQRYQSSAKQVSPQSLPEVVAPGLRFVTIPAATRIGSEEPPLRGTKLRASLFSAAYSARLRKFDCLSWCKVLSAIDLSRRPQASGIVLS